MFTTGHEDDAIINLFHGWSSALTILTALAWNST